MKGNEQSLKEIWDYVKRQNLPLIGVPECDGENESKLENTLQVIQDNFPKLARQANIQVQEIQRKPQRYSSKRATPRHIIVRFTRAEIKKKMLRADREKGWVTHKGKPIRHCIPGYMCRMCRFVTQVYMCHGGLLYLLTHHLGFVFHMH